MFKKYEKSACAKVLFFSRKTLRFPRLYRSILFLVLSFLLLHSAGFGLGQERYVETVARPGSFPLAQGGVAASIYVDANDYPGVVRAAHDLQSDIARVTGDTAAIEFGPSHLGSHVIIIGTIGKSPLVDQLIRGRRIDVSRISHQWESFLIQVVAKPLPGVESGLVIAGSDKRGTIYGIYEISEQIGVSPWYWWADVPVASQRRTLCESRRVRAGAARREVSRHFPQRRGAISPGWVQEKFGGSTISSTRKCSSCCCG